MRVYPWRQKDNQGDRKLVMKVATSLSSVFKIAGGVLSLGIGSVVGLILVRRFAKRNDSWAKRGGILTLLPLALFLALGGPMAWVSNLNDLLLSFGTKAEGSPTMPLIGFVIRTVLFGFIFQGIAVMMTSYVYEVTGDRYLERVKPTIGMKRRAAKNEAALVVNNKPHQDSIVFGIIVDDPIPWRTSRYGMICARPFKELGHGAIVGGSGTGKTVLALNLSYQASTLDACVFYIDFKASLRTLEGAKKTAAKAGKKFYSFDLGTGSTESSWFDPLDWPGTSSEKASMLVNSFNFTEDGSASYYRGQANDWLIMQFDVLAEVGLYSGESSFDFLLKTADPAELKKRIAVLRSGTPQEQEAYTTFTAKIEMFKVQDLSALRQNLSIVVSSGGDRLRPQSDSPAILMSRAAKEGAYVYFGLSPATDQVALKIIGSLILRNLGVLAGERMRQADVAALRPILTIVDEASRLQDRADVLDNLLATAREAEIYLWMITQSFATWPKSTVVEMNTNVQTHVAFRVQDVETAEHLVSTLGEVPLLTEMTEDKVSHRAFQGDVKERSGDARTTLGVGPFLSDAPMEIPSIENLHAYVWFTGSWNRATIEEWSSKRLKKPDSIRNDAPLVRIVFMDFESEAPPITGTSFSELVTSADDITYNMENTTLKRTRQGSLQEDHYPHQTLPEAGPTALRWNDAPAQQNRPQQPAWNTQQVTSEHGQPPAQPAWNTPPQPQWADDNVTPYSGAPAAPYGQSQHPAMHQGETFEEDHEAPPAPFFYKSGSKPLSGQAGKPPEGTHVAEENPVEGNPAPAINTTPAQPQPSPAPIGIQWDDEPQNQPRWTTEQSQPTPSVDAPAVHPASASVVDASEGVVEVPAEPEVVVEPVKPKGRGSAADRWL